MRDKTTRHTRIALLVILAATLVACAGSSKAKGKITTTTSAATTSAAPTTTAAKPDPNAPKPVAGTNGVTVTYKTKNSGVIAPKVTKTSQTTMPGKYGGALFRLAHGSDPAIYGSAEGDVFPLLHTLPGWQLTKLSDDPAWTPGACSSSPNTVVGDRWLVTAEGTGGEDPNNPTNGAEFNQYFVRAYDRQTNTYAAVTPITTAEPKRWKGPVWTMSPTEVAIIGSSNVGWSANAERTDKPDVVRVINLQNMTFRDLPYQDPPDPEVVAKKDYVGEPTSSDVQYTSNATGKTLRLTNVNAGQALKFGENKALIEYDNETLMPSKIGGQVGVWDMTTGAWSRAFDTQRPADPSVLPAREPFHGVGSNGFGIWFLAS